MFKNRADWTVNLLCKTVMAKVQDEFLQICSNAEKIGGAHRLPRHQKSLVRGVYLTCLQKVAPVADGDHESFALISRFRGLSRLSWYLPTLNMLVVMRVDNNLFEVQHMTCDRRETKRIKKRPEDYDCPLKDVTTLVRIVPETRSIICLGRPGLAPNTGLEDYLENFCCECTQVCSHSYSVLYYLYLNDRQRYDELVTAVVSMTKFMLIVWLCVC